MFANHYNTARQSGLLAPLAACVAAWKVAPTAARQLQAVRPLPALAIFGLAYVAGLIGSTAALLVAAAFLVGLHLAQPAAAPIYLRHKSQPATQPAAAPTAGAVNAAPHPFADQLAAGLVVREIKLGQPAANGRPKVKTE